MRIRSCHEGDLDAIRKFVDFCRPLDLHTPFTYWVLLHFFGSTCFVMEEEGKLIGFVTAMTGSDREGVCFLWQIGVDPSYRGKHHADRLIERVVEVATAKGCRAVQVTIAPENKESFSLFSRVAAQRGLAMKRIGVVDFIDSLTGKRVFEYHYEITL